LFLVIPGSWKVVPSVWWRTEKPVGKVIMDRSCERKGHVDKNRVDRGQQSRPGINLK
jgi:hypothetical protein